MYNIFPPSWTILQCPSISPIQVTTCTELSSLCYSRNPLAIYFTCGSVCHGEGNGNPFQYSCLENPVVGESCGRRSLVCCCPWGHTESETTEVTQQQQQCMSVLIFQFIPPSFPASCPNIHSLGLHFYSCLGNKFICTVFLESYA